MISSLLKVIGGIFFNPSTTKTITKAVTHTFKKHPMQHADKAIKAAFKVGVETGKKFVK